MITVTVTLNITDQAKEDTLVKAVAYRNTQAGYMGQPSMTMSEYLSDLISRYLDGFGGAVTALEEQATTIKATQDLARNRGFLPKP